MLTRRVVNANADVLDEIEGLAYETRLELEERFDKLEISLQALAAPQKDTSADDTAELRKIQEEMESTQKWLTTLAQISKHIDRARSDASTDVSATQKSRYTQVATLGDLISASRITSDGLQKFSGSLTKVTNKLEDHLQQMNNRKQSLSVQNTQVSDTIEGVRQQVQNEQDVIKTCLSICDEVSEEAEKVRENVFENVRAGKDSSQIIVSSIGDLIVARNVTAESGAIQCLGQMPGATVQHVSSDRTTLLHSARNSAADRNAKEGYFGEAAGPEKAKGRKARGKEDGAQNGILYDIQYGKGYNL